ncbi:hypothetical protein V8G54_010421 [Vigna mungo]|uniref:Cytochrome P450 n=1 Tax=Vigna mungo TaxID=3915 RepID=A0AAQ3S317_VIGMU
MAGKDTATLTIVWALYELINHPDVMARARQEIDEIDDVIGSGRLVDESDLANLTYKCIRIQGWRIQIQVVEQRHLSTYPDPLWTYPVPSSPPTDSDWRSFRFGGGRTSRDGVCGLIRCCRRRFRLGDDEAQWSVSGVRSGVRAQMVPLVRRAQMVPLVRRLSIIIFPPECRGSSYSHMECGAPGHKSRLLKNEEKHSNTKT